jgi:hypothetical protein
VGVVGRAGVVTRQAAFSATMAWRPLRTTVPAVTGATVMVGLAWRLGGSPFLAALSSMSAPALVLALAIGAGTTALSALRWMRAARLLRLPLPPSRAVSDYYAALFLNAVLPSGIVGDVRRAARHGRQAGTMRNAMAALLLERSAGQVVLVGIMAVVWLRPGWPLVVATLVAIAASAAVRPRPVLSMRVFREGFVLFGASVGILAGHVAMFVLAARTAGVEVPVGTLIQPALVALLAMSLPLNLAGWGPREGATAWAFASANLGAGRGVTVAVLYGVFALIASLPGAVVLLGRGGPTATPNWCASSAPRRTSGSAPFRARRAP